ARFGLGPGTFEIAGFQGSHRLLDYIFFGLRSRLWYSPWIGHHEHTGALQPEDGLRHIELRASQEARHGPQVTGAIDSGQYFPFVGQQIELTFGSRSYRRQGRYDAQVRDLALDLRPFVDPARAFHEQRFGRDPDGRVGGQRFERPLDEGEVSF